MKRQAGPPDNKRPQYRSGGGSSRADSQLGIQRLKFLSGSLLKGVSNAGGVTGCDDTLPAPSLTNPVDAQCVRGRRWRGTHRAPRKRALGHGLRNVYTVCSAPPPYPPPPPLLPPLPSSPKRVWRMNRPTYMVPKKKKILAVDMTRVPPGHTSFRSMGFFFYVVKYSYEGAGGGGYIVREHLSLCEVVPQSCSGPTSVNDFASTLHSTLWHGIA